MYLAPRVYCKSVNSSLPMKHGYYPAWSTNILVYIDMIKKDPQKVPSDDMPSSVSGVAHSLKKHLQVILVDLKDARVECAVPCACVTALLRVEERETEFATDWAIS